MAFEQALRGMQRALTKLATCEPQFRQDWINFYMRYQARAIALASR